MGRTRALCAALLLSLVPATGCHRDAPPRRPHPVILVGIDGADWSVIRELWARGELPNLRRLAERGTSATLHTAYGISPVIWTSIATGQPARVHGITDFVVATPAGDVPVSSSVRRVPALWNMASTAGRSVAVVSWWASWPAEPVRGVVVSDRALLAVPDAVSPAAFAARFAALRAQALAAANPFGGNPAAAERDQVTAAVGRELSAQRRDLTMVYFRGVDVASHNFWRFFRPKGFGAAAAVEAPRHADEIPRVYAATDAAIGRILAAAPRANVFVVSDHGFRRLPREEVVVTLDLDRVLERLGYLRRRADGGVDMARSRVFTFASRPSAPVRQVRFALAGREPGGTVLPQQRAALGESLSRDLARVTWDDGELVFRGRQPRENEARQSGDLMVVVLPPASAVASSPLRLDGIPWAGMVPEVSRISGSHGAKTHGIFIAAGPDLVPGADASGIEIFDVAPTILFALGLPVAEDFTGRARVDLFTRELRNRQPLRSIATWGAPRQGRATASSADAEVLRELRALGYLR